MGQIVRGQRIADESIRNRSKQNYGNCMRNVAKVQGKTVPQQFVVGI